MTRAVGLLLLAPLAGFLWEAATSVRFELPAAPWGRTLAIAGGASLLAALAGLPTGLLIAGTRRRWPAALTLLPLLLPPAVAAATWMGLRLPGPGLAGCACILAVSYWPVVALLVAAAARRIPRTELEAAELQLTRMRLMRLVVWPHVRPALGAGALLVFVLAASEFTVPATFAITTASTVIYERLSGFEYGSAAIASLPLIAAAIAVALALKRMPSLATTGRARAVPCGKLCWIAAVLAWGASVAVPALVCAKSIRSVSGFAHVIGSNAESFGWSALLAGFVAIALVTWASLSPRRSRLEPLWLASLALPGVVTALGALRLPGHEHLTESGALLALAIMSRLAFIAWLPLREPVEPSQLEAAKLAELPHATAWRRILLPALAPRAAATGAIVFMLALGEIGPAVLLSPPGRQTIVQHLFNWMHYGYDETVASLSLVLMAAAAVVTWMGTHVARFDHDSRTA